MTPTVGFYGCGIMLGLAMLGVALLRPSWVEVIGVEVAPLQQIRGRGTHLVDARPECEVARRRSSLKEKVIGRLLNGELTLTEAIAWFQELNAHPPEHPDLGHLSFPGLTPEEKIGRQVIAWLKGRQVDSLSRAEQDRRIKSLEAQFHLHLRRLPHQPVAARE